MRRWHTGRHEIVADRVTDEARQYRSYADPDEVKHEEQHCNRQRALDFKAIPKNAQVHGFGEYLAHPAVHVPLFRILAGDQDWISDADETAAHERYNAANPPLDAGNLKRQAIEALVQRAGASEWFARIALWKEVLDAFAG